jgi:hypothetical protein
MIRVSPTGANAPSAPARKTAKASGAFRVEGGARPAGAATQAQAAAPVETLTALIALQSGESGAGQGRARTLAAAQRTLDLLDRMRLGLLDGAVSNEDLDALSHSASLSASATEVDGTLAALYEEIVLRARVELAKRGR